MSSSELVFGRISITNLIKAQEDLLRYVNDSEEINPLVFAQKYNRATLGLLNDRDHIIDVMIRLNKLKDCRVFLQKVLPVIFKQVLRKALEYKAEIRQYREIEEVKIEDEHG